MSRTQPGAAQPWGSGQWGLRLAAARLSTAWHILRDAGLKEFLLSLLHRFAPRWVNPLLAPFVRRRLARAAQQEAGRPVLIYVATSDHGYPFKQRQQHLARALSRWCRVFYVSPRQGFDRFWGVRMVAPGLYLADMLEPLTAAFPQAKVLLLSVDTQLPERLKLLNGRLDRVIYDYIDALDEAVERMPVPEGRRQAHARLLGEPDAWVLASARSLLADAAKVRQGRLALVTNGVDVAHYRVGRERAGLSEAYLRFLDAGRPVLGYFGALASWVDYDLLLRLAQSRPGYGIALIGGDYDGSLARRGKDFPENVLCHPRVDYDRLPRYAAWFDVCLVPFVCNAVTEATSPLKLFEYMAMGRPIVSTGIPEARNYASVLTANTSDEFISLVDKAMDLRFAPERLALLRAEAEANSWESKAADIARLVGFLSL